MTDLRPELESAQIVVRGDMNPAIIHPAWLAARGLLSEEAASDAEVSMVSQEVTAFDLDWISLRVTQDSFVASSSDRSQYFALRNLVLGTFDYLEYTPVRQLGLNRRMHFKLDDEERLHQLGHRLAPKEPWEDVLKGIGETERPGLRSLTMEGSREDSDAAYIRVKVEPSVQVRRGLYFQTNEHYELGEEEGAIPEMTVILRNAWDDAQDFALRVASHLLKGGAA